MQKQYRNSELDGLRGLAALAVALGHCNTNVTGYEVWQKSVVDFPEMTLPQIMGRLGHVLFPADAAVIVFFVLSGYVLWGAMLRRGFNSLLDLAPYMTSRIYRLFPVVIMSTLILAFFMPVAAKDVAENALLLNYQLNGVQWSLQIELAASFLLFMGFLVIRKNLLFLIFFLVSFYVWTRYLPALLWYFIPFILGASLHYISSRLFQMRWLAVMAYLALVSADLLFQRHYLSLIIRFASAGFLVGAVLSNKYDFLNRPFAQFLGDVSYSFYLSHCVGVLLAKKMIIYLGLQSVNQFAEFLYMIVFSIGIALPLGCLLRVFVEKPGIAAGSGVSQLVNQWIQEKLPIKRAFSSKVDAIVNA